MQVGEDRLAPFVLEADVLKRDLAPHPRERPRPRQLLDLREGVEDLKAGIESPQALLVAIGRPRLRRLGVMVPDTPFASPEARLYQHFWRADPDAAHARYNALLRRLVSFERTAECAA